MKLTSKQIKAAKTACIENGIDPRYVGKEFSQCFWECEAQGSIEGYIDYLVNGQKPDGSTLSSVIAKSNANYRAGNYGASSL